MGSDPTHARVSGLELREPIPYSSPNNRNLKVFRIPRHVWKPDTQHPYLTHKASGFLAHVSPLTPTALLTSGAENKPTQRLLGNCGVEGSGTSGFGGGAMGFTLRRSDVRVLFRLSGGEGFRVESVGGCWC